MSAYGLLRLYLHDSPPPPTLGASGPLQKLLFTPRSFHSPCSKRQKQQPLCNPLYNTPRCGYQLQRPHFPWTSHISPLRSSSPNTVSQLDCEPLMDLLKSSNLARIQGLSCHLSFHPCPQESLLFFLPPPLFFLNNHFKKYLCERQRNREKEVFRLLIPSSQEPGTPCGWVSHVSP